MKKVNLHQFFLVTVLFFASVFMTPVETSAKAARAEGSWKLVRVDIIQLKDCTSFTNGSRQGSLRMEECSDGCLSGSGSMSGPNGVVAEWQGAVSWTSPPKRIEPDKSFTLTFRETTKHRKGDRILFSGTNSDAYTKSMKDCNVDFSEDLYTKSYHVRSKELSDHEKTVTDTFEAPFQSSQEKDKLLMIVASFGGATDDVYNPASISRVFVYRYRWTSEGPQKLQCGLKLHVTCNGGAPVEGFSVKVLCTDLAEPDQLVTDAKGIIDHIFEAETKEDCLTLEFLEGKITGRTRYMDAPVFISELKVPLTGLPPTVKLEPGNNQKANLAFELPVFKLSVYGHIWRKDSSDWVPGSANLLFQNPEKFCKVDPARFKTLKNLCVADLLLPTREVIGNRVMIWAVLNQLDDSRALNPPDMDGRFKPVQVSFYLSDLATRIARIRAKMKAFFSKPEFAGILTEKQINCIVNMKIEVLSALKRKAGSIIPDKSEHDDDLSSRLLQAQWVLGDDCTFKYSNGVIYIRDENFLDVGKSANADSVFHEWTHATMGVLADDRGVEDRVGGKHDTWTPANTEETAWDEGRAHFGSTIFSFALDTPGDLSFTTDKVRDKIKNNSQWNNSGNNVEGVITGALLQYYRDAGFKKNANVLSHFLKVQEECRKNLGHPPRTSGEFFDTLAQMDKSNSRLSTLVENIKKEYGIK